MDSHDRALENGDVLRTSKEYRELGMDRRIARRDFFNGVAVGIGGAWAATRGLAATSSQGQTAPASRLAPAGYPPLRTGLRGNHPESVAEFPRMRQGAYTRFPVLDVDTREDYDLVVVGAGISGLAAAYFWRRALGPKQTILVLDNSDDFGGHAKRNEFQWEGRTFIAPAGTLGISTPFPYSYTSKALIAELGIQPERGGEFANRALEAYKLSNATFFDKEHFGVDRLVVGGRQNWEAFLAKAPISEAARNDLLRLYGGHHPDYMPGLDAARKKAALARMSYGDFLVNHVKITPDALPLVTGFGGRNSKKIDTMPALEAAESSAAGFSGMGLTWDRPMGREGAYNIRWADGAAGISRLLVKKLLPDVVSGEQSMDSILSATVHYAALDRPGSPTRIRLSSSVVRVLHDGGPEEAASVRIAYVKNGRVHGVRARNIVLACYNAIIPALMPELPAEQKDALAYAVKVPQCPINVLIRRWTAFVKAGVDNITAPKMPLGGISLAAGSTLGGYRGVTTPEEPIVARMGASPAKTGSGLPRREQLRQAQHELLATSFAQFELDVRRSFARMLGSYGFDPAAEILAITVNRWPYGYAYTYDTLGDPDMPPERRPHVIGRRRFGRVTVANSDAGAAAFINQAIDEAHRAIQELLVKNGLT